jgi:hypothetical protein
MTPCHPLVTSTWKKEKATTTAPLLVREGSALSAFQRRFLMNNPTASSLGLVEHLCFE